MFNAGSLRAGMYGAVIGLVVGLLVIFASVVNALVGPRYQPREQAAETRIQAGLSATPVVEFGSRGPDSEQTLRRIAVIQARAGDIDAALKTIDASKDPAHKDAMRFDVVNDYVYDYHNRKLGSSQKPGEEVYKNARKVADTIADPVVKADALRSIAAAQEMYYADNAKKTLGEAAKMTQDAPWVTESPGKIFNVWMLLWPAGLAVFGFLIVLLSLPLIDAYAEALAPGDIDVEPAAKS